MALFVKRGFDRIIRDRHSCHNFSDRRPSARAVLEAVDAANQTPLAGNISVLKFLMVSDDDLITKVSRACQQEFLSDCKTLVIVCSNTEQLIRAFPDKGLVYARQQAGAAIQNFLLKVEELGMDSCWVGHFSEKTIKRIFKIPKEFDIEAVLPVGWEQKLKAREVKKKPELHECLFYDKWDKKRFG